jgi:Big-like domain-containing protein/Kelch motif protein/galactose oxidase-like protein
MTRITRRAIQGFAGIVFFALLAACGGGDSGGTDAPASLVTISVTPPFPTVAKGQTRQFVATGTYSDSSTRDLTSTVTWSSGGTPVTINSAGLAQGATVGAGAVTATLGSISGSTQLSVTPAVLTSIVIAPAAPNSNVGLQLQLTATGTWSDNTTADITSTATWSSGTSSVANIAGTGLTTSLTAGTSTLTATSAGVSGSTELTVAPPALTTIAITPASPTSGVGYKLQLKATGTYTDGHIADLTSAATWSSGTPGIATMGTGGLTTGVAVGSSTIIVSSGAIQGSTPLTVASPVWLPAAQLATGRSGHTATLLANGKVLVVGVDTAELYDPVTDTWSSAGSLNTVSAPRTATLLANGKVLVVGVNSALPTVTSSELYDAVANSWSPGGNLGVARVYFSAALLPNGEVLVAGGCYVTPACGATELYDPTTNTWSAAASLAEGRYLFTMTSLQDGRVLAAGGHSVPTIHSNVAGAEVYDPVANTWSAAGTLATARFMHSAALLSDGRVLIAGGRGPGNPLVSSAEVYDPVANSWSTVASLSVTRGDFGVLTLPGGKVLAAGGWTDDPSHGALTLASAELYDPASNMWAATASMTEARQQFTLTLLQNGRPLAVGGVGDGVAGSQSSAEFYQD